MQQRWRRRIVLSPRENVSLLPSSKSLAVGQLELEDDHHHRLRSSLGRGPATASRQRQRPPGARRRWWIPSPLPLPRPSTHTLRLPSCAACNSCVQVRRSRCLCAGAPPPAPLSTSCSPSAWTNGANPGGCSSPNEGPTTNTLVSLSSGFPPLPSASLPLPRQTRQGGQVERKRAK